ncbi:hypothetical protein [Sphingomonas sp. M1-B02]|uniref:hypothetical protein n=1 Tax=Sphingomonas sp. M1-B02 TaxID=3114300 RepID=UPI002240D5CC|nr:hypothetical protein [Sphingomonas sp. S6-11]UZK67269.1 hypothetical protein OKW87_05400 [Sphingomonas sp. S6-11]
MTRLLAEMQTNILATALPIFDGNLDRFILYALIVRQSYSGGVGAGDAGASRAISTHSIATSLSRSFETVRRHINGMIDEGLCVRVEGGIAANPQTLFRPEFERALARAHDSFVRFVEDLKHFGLALPEERNGERYVALTGIQSVVDIMLAVAESNRTIHHDWLELVIFSTILCANSRDITYSPVLAPLHGYAGAVPPDELRRPVRVVAVARVLGIPEATVRRRVELLLRDGRAVRVRNGLLISEEWLNAREPQATSANIFHTIRIVLNRLATAGFPFAAPSRAYLSGRPTPVRFG